MQKEWNRWKVVCNKVAGLMSQAGDAFKGLLRTATGVVFGLAEADEWLAPYNGDPYLVQSSNHNKDGQYFHSNV